MVNSTVEKITEIFSPKNETETPKEPKIPMEVSHFFDKENITYTPEKAQADASILEILNKDPYIPRDVLERDLKIMLEDKMGGVEDFIGQRLEKIMARREAVQQVLSEYESPAKLYKHLFGVEPKGELDVIPSALSINLICYNEQDLEFIFEETYTQHPRLSIRGTLYACAARECLDTRVNRAVLAVGANQKVNDELDSPIHKLNHEEMHIINWLFMEENDLHIMDVYPDKEIIANMPYEERVRVLEGYLVAAKELTLEQITKFELAGYIEQGATVERAGQLVERYQISEREPLILKNYFTQGLTDEQKEHIYKVVDRVFVGYDDVVKRACESLQKMEEAGYANREIAMRLVNTYLRQLA